MHARNFLMLLFKLFDWFIKHFLVPDSLLVIEIVPQMQLGQWNFINFILLFVWFNL